MRALYIQSLNLWPRFEAHVKECLKASEEGREFEVRHEHCFSSFRTVSGCARMKWFSKPEHKQVGLIGDSELQCCNASVLRIHNARSGFDLKSTRTYDLHVIDMIADSP